MSCICVVLEKQMVLRTKRFMRVCKVTCVRSIFWVCRLPGLWTSASRCRVYAPQYSVEKRVRPKGSNSAWSWRKTSSLRRPKTDAKTTPVVGCWVGARRVTLRHVSSRPPFSTGRAALTASGAAPGVILHAYHGASVSISVAFTEVHPCLIPFHQHTLAVLRGNSLRIRWVLCSPLTFVLRTSSG